jgi:hypothetical protein
VDHTDFFKWLLKLFKTKYRKEYYLKNKEKLIEHGKKYYNERIYPKVENEVKHGDFVLHFD